MNATGRTRARSASGPAAGSCRCSSSIGRWLELLRIAWWICAYWVAGSSACGDAAAPVDLDGVDAPRREAC